MYIVEIKNGDFTTEIHGVKTKLTSGKIVKGINTIDSFTFSMSPSNAGFNLINEFSTLVSAYNTNKDRYDFVGRVLYAETTMDESGLITKTVTCESVLGYLCDSWQTYVDTQNWTVAGLLKHLLDCHNSLVEGHKQFKLGNVTAKDSNDNLYQAVQREKTWDAIKTKLIDKIGGELQVRIEEDGMYLDYLDQIGEMKDTEIALSVNMKSITREQDPTAFITRLIPLGCKLKATVEKTDEAGNVTTEEVETEHRLDISSVNGGKTYIDDEQAVAVYGIHVGVVEWDDVTDPTNLKNKGKSWLEENNKVQIKYSITALDLSLIGKVFDDFYVGNYHPIKNGLIAVDDTARIIKKNIDVCEEVKSTMEVGDNFKTLSDIQREQATQIQQAAQNLKDVKQQSSTLVADINKRIGSLDKKIDSTAERLTEDFSSEIQQLSDSIKMEVSGTLGSEASIILSVGANKYTGEFDLSQIRTAFANDNTAISVSAGTITFNSGTIIINSTNFKVDAEGVIEATSGTIGGWTLKSYKLYAGDGADIKTVAIQAPTANNLYVFAAGGTSHDSYADCPFRVTKAGKLYATDAVVHGDIITIDGSFKTQLDRGSMRLYYNDTLCGTINTKYWSGASTEGVSLRVEEGGNYIMFSHADDTQGSGYTVDYYLNAGWSSNYDEMHIFQTSARFLDDVYFAGYTRIRSLRLFGSGGEYLVGISSSGQLTVSKL